MVIGNSNNQTFACYLTTAGSVYCGGPSTASTSEENGGGWEGDKYYHYADEMSWASAIAPWSYWNNGANNVLATSYSTVTANNVVFPYSSNYYLRTYWLKVDTSKFDSSSTTAGTTITLTGKNLSKVTNVYIDTNNNSALDEGTDIAVSNLKIISDTQLTFTAPSMSPGTYNLIITNPGNVVVKGTLTYR